MHVGKAFFGSAEPNPEGAAAALKALCLTGKVLNVGFDASPAEVSLLKSGGINATVAQPAAQEGAGAAQFAHDKVTGNTGGITTSVQLPDVVGAGSQGALLCVALAAYGDYPLRTRTARGAAAARGGTRGAGGGGR